MQIDTPPTLEELYMRASSSTRLVPDSKVVSLIAAAGMVRDSLGLSLLRLRAEFDRAKSATPPQALDGLAAQLADLRTAEAASLRNTRAGPTNWAKVRAERESCALLIHRLARAYWLTATTRMPSLPSASAAFAASAERLALQHGNPPTSPEVLAASALHWWLDPSCPACGGTGLVGPHGSVRTRCPICRGRCYRELPYRRSAERDFVSLLVSELDRKASIALSQLSRTYRGNNSSADL